MLPGPLPTVDSAIPTFPTDNKKQFAPSPPKKRNMSDPAPDPPVWNGQSTKEINPAQWPSKLNFVVDIFRVI